VLFSFFNKSVADVGGAGGSDSGSAGFDHCASSFISSDAAGSFYAHFGTNGFAHEADIFNSCAAGGETGGSFYKFSTCTFCCKNFYVFVYTFFA
jgi:hypothetical protein